MLVAQHGLVSGSSQAPVDVSYLADTVLLIRYFEAMGTVKQALSVVKKRSGAHERTIRELRLQSDGIKVGPVLESFHGVLSGTPTYGGAAAPS
jgi:circadian clock protein KaiC